MCKAMRSAHLNFPSEACETYVERNQCGSSYETSKRRSKILRAATTEANDPDTIRSLTLCRSWLLPFSEIPGLIPWPLQEWCFLQASRKKSVFGKLLSLFLFALRLAFKGISSIMRPTSRDRYQENRHRENEPQCKLRRNSTLYKHSIGHINCQDFSIEKSSHILRNILATGFSIPD